MRKFQAARAVLLVFCTLATLTFAGPARALAADSSPSTPAPSIQADAASVPSAPPIPTPTGTPPAGMDTPPPFVQRPVRRSAPSRPDFTFARRAAPEQFRGLAWGTGVEQARATLADLAPVQTPVPLRDTFARPGELLKLGEADLRSVAYYFPKGKLMGVGIVFEGEANYFLIKEHLLAQYGPGRQLGDRYGWTWPTFSIELRMRGQLGELRYTHAP